MRASWSRGCCKGAGDTGPRHRANLEDLHAARLVHCPLRGDTAEFLALLPQRKEEMLAGNLASLTPNRPGHEAVCDLGAVLAFSEFGAQCAH